MVETVPKYGRLDKIALQDSVLQFLKKCEALVYRHRYKALERESYNFHSEKRKYDHYPKLSDTASILIFKPDDIGDAVYSLPAIVQLRKCFPKAKIYLLCQAKTKELFERAGLFDQIVGVDPRTRWLRFQFFDLESALDRFPVETFELAIYLRGYPAYFRYFKKIRALQSVLPKDPRLQLSSQFTAYVTPRAHQSKQMLEIIERVTPEIATDIVFPSFKWSAEDKKEMSAPYFVVHPYARFETRRYPYEYWQNLLVSVQNKTGKKIVVIGGKDDPSLNIPGVIEMQGQLSLCQTGYLISKSSGFIGNESGPGHWASVMGIPTVMILSGHSHVSEWGPLGNNLVLKRSVPCENCYLRACPKYKVRCLTELRPESIEKSVIDFLSTERSPR